jgi:hypothetical protein
MKTVAFEGKTYGFPDDASNDEIAGALQSHVPTIGEDVARSAAAGGAQGAINSAMAGPLLVNDVAQGAAWLAKKAGYGDTKLPSASGWLADKLSGVASPETLARFGIAPGGGGSINEGQAQQAANREAIQNAQGGQQFYDYQPQTTAGKYTKAGTQFATAGAIYSPKGAVNALKGALVGGTAGIGSEAARQAAEGTPYETLASLGGAAAGQLLAHRAMGAATRPAIGGPTEDQLQAKVNAGYDAIRQAGGELKHAPIRNGAKQALSAIESAGATETSPTSVGVLNRLAEAPETKLENMGDVMSGQKPAYTPDRTISIQEILDAQQALSPKNKLGMENPAGRAIANKFLHNILENVKPEDVISGNPAATSAALKETAANAKALRNSRLITNADERANITAEAANSGHNYSGSARQQLKALITPRLEGVNPYARSMSPELQEAIRNQGVRGSGIGNFVREWGNKLGGGGGVGNLFAGAVGSEAAGDLLHFPGARELGFVAGIGGGRALRGIDNMMVQRSINKLGQMARGESPLGQQMGARPFAGAQPPGPMIGNIVPNIYPSAITLARARARHDRSKD